MRVAPLALRSPLIDMDLTPYVAEAVTTLGLVRVAAIDWLTKEIRVAHTRNNGRTIREGGRRLTPAERLALGLPKWGDHFSVDVWDALTEDGRRGDPAANFDDTCARAVSAARRDAQRARVLPILRHFAGVEMAPPPAVGLCAAGLAQAGRMFAEPPDLPFPGCDARVCGCAWRMISRRELERR